MIRMLTLVVLASFSLSHSAQAADEVAHISACSVDKRLACHLEQAQTLAEATPPFRQNELLSLIAQHYLAADQQDKLNRIVAIMAAKPANPSPAFHELIVALASAGKDDAVKRLLPSIYLCMPHPHSACMPPTIATDAALLLMKQMIARADGAAALDIGFLAIRYNGGLSNQSFHGDAISEEFYSTLAGLDFLSRFKQELAKLNDDPRADSVVSGDPEESQAAWEAEQDRYNYQQYANRLLILLVFSPEHIADLPSSMPKSWTPQDKANFYIAAARLLSKVESARVTDRFRQLALEQISLLITDEKKRNTSIKWVDSALGRSSHLPTAGELAVDAMNLLRANKYDALEGAVIKACTNHAEQASLMNIELYTMANAIISNYLSVGQGPAARGFFEKLLNCGLPADRLRMMRLTLEIAENNQKAARATVNEFFDIRAKFSALLMYSAYVEDLHDEQLIHEAFELAENILAPLSSKQREELLNSFVFPMPMMTSWSQQWSGSNLLIRTLIKKYHPTDDVNDPQYYYVRIAEQEIRRKEFAEAEKTIALISNGEALRKAQMILALGLADDGQINAALKAAPDIIWDKARPELYRAADRTDLGQAMWDTKRAELIKYVAPVNYNMAFKLAQEILDPYELAKANIYLAVSKN